MEARRHALDHALDLLQVRGALLHSDDVGVRGELADELGWEIDSGELREIVNEDRDARDIGDGAKERDLRLGARHQAAIIVRREDQRRMIAEIGGSVGQMHGLADGFHAGAGHQRLPGARGIADGGQQL
jgi:hypothetical protein